MIWFDLFDFVEISEFPYLPVNKYLHLISAIT